LDGVEGRLDGVEGRLDGVEGQLISMDRKLDLVAEQTTLSKKVLANHEKRISKVEKVVLTT
jgi:cell division protein FtsL